MVCDLRQLFLLVGRRAEFAKLEYTEEAEKRRLSILSRNLSCIGARMLASTLLVFKNTYITGTLNLSHYLTVCLISPCLMEDMDKTSFGGSIRFSRTSFLQPLLKSCKAAVLLDEPRRIAIAREIGRISLSKLGKLVVLFLSVHQFHLSKRV